MVGGGRLHRDVRTGVLLHSTSFGQKWETQVYSVFRMALSSTATLIDQHHRPLRQSLHLGRCPHIMFQCPHQASDQRAKTSSYSEMKTLRYLLVTSQIPAVAILGRPSRPRRALRRMPATCSRHRHLFFERHLTPSSRRTSVRTLTRWCSASVPKASDSGAENRKK